MTNYLWYSLVGALLIYYWFSFLLQYYKLTLMNILICTLQGSYLVLTLSLFLHKIFFKLGLVWNATLNPNFCFCFFYFRSDFWYQRKDNCVLFVSVVIIIVVETTRFLFKVINYLLQYFSIMSIFAKHISQIFYFRLQIFFRTEFGSSCNKSFEYAGNGASGYTRM